MGSSFQKFCEFLVVLADNKTDISEIRETPTSLYFFDPRSKYLSSSLRLPMTALRRANGKRFVNGECKRTVDAKLNYERMESTCWMHGEGTLSELRTIAKMESRMFNGPYMVNYENTLKRILCQSRLVHVPIFNTKSNLINWEIELNLYHILSLFIHFPPCKKINRVFSV